MKEISKLFYYGNNYLKSKVEHSSVSMPECLFETRGINTKTERFTALMRKLQYITCTFYTFFYASILSNMKAILKFITMNFN